MNPNTNFTRPLSARRPAIHFDLQARQIPDILSPVNHMSRSPPLQIESSKSFNWWKQEPQEPRQLALWELSQRSTKGPYELCRSCQSIDFDRLLGEPMLGPHHKDRIFKGHINLGRVEELFEDCPFCRLVIDCVWQSRHCGKEDILLHTVKSSNLSFDEITPKSYDTLPETRRTQNGRKAYSLALSVCVDDVTIRIGHIQYCADKEPLDRQLFFGRRVDQFQPNFDLICSWLPKCQSVHGESCERIGQSPPGHNEQPMIRVIDTHRRLVVPGRSDGKYIALSYCWGAPGDCEHVKTLQAHVRGTGPGQQFIVLDDIAQRLPQTVEDAMLVTQRLGFRYLWVDALCIVQDNEKEKRIQIHQMDRIYSSAVLTIVAASGHHANHGLSGISRPREIAQRTEIINGLRFALPLPGYRSIESSTEIPWNSRGWTFQEKVLSKRLLWFTDYQVYFKCSQLEWCEDAVFEGDLCFEETWTPRSRIDSFTNFFDARAYAYYVEQFTPRALGNPGDGLNAVTGVLARLGSVRMDKWYGGLPEKLFGPALFWQPKLGSFARCRKSHVKSPFPTWSWARWKLSQGCVYTENFRVQLERTFLSQEVFLLVREDQMHLVKLEAPFKNLQTGEAEMADDSSEADDEEASPARNSAPKWLNSTPPYPTLTEKEKRYIGKVKYTLYFEAILVKNILVGELAQPDQKRILGTQNTFECYTLHDTFSRPIGEITMSTATRDEIGRNSIDLITVGWTEPGGNLDEEEVFALIRRDSKLEVDDLSWVRVMFVVWNGKLAKRVAVGRIVRAAWERLKGGSKWVVLG